MRALYHSPQYQMAGEKALSVAAAQWLSRLRRHAADPKSKGAFLLNPKGNLVPVQLSDENEVSELLWHNSEKEMMDFKRWSLHPVDCEYALTFGGNNHYYVFMSWRPMEQSESKNINIPAARLLLEHRRMDPPIIQTDLMDHTQLLGCLPSEHVVLFAVDRRTRKLIQYTKDMVHSDWSSLVRNSRHVKSYERLLPRYQHGLQALVEYRQTGRMNVFTRWVIEEITGCQVGKVSHWDNAQLTVLAAAVCLLYPVEWKRTTDLPRIVPQVVY
jgi:hypothetical protein